MTARDWLGLLVRAFGVYLCVTAVMGAADTLIDLLFGNHLFGLTFRSLLSATVAAGVGFVLMTRAEELVRRMYPAS